MTKRNIPTPTQFEGTVYYRQRSVLVVAPSFVAKPGDRTLLRKSIRLLLGCTRPFQVEFAHGKTFETRAVLFSPHAECRQISGESADIAIVDFAKASPEFQATETLLQDSPFIFPDIEKFQPWLPALITGQDGTLSNSDVTHLMTTMVEALTGTPLPTLKVDPRIAQALQLIETSPLDEITLARLAPAVKLSTERFRHLFKESTGINVSTYTRQLAVWRALEAIEKGASITEASHQAGFYDVSHFYKAYADLFGVNLCEKNNIRKFRRVRYFE